MVTSCPEPSNTHLFFPVDPLRGVRDRWSGSMEEYFILSSSKLNNTNEVALSSLILCSHQLSHHPGFHRRRGKEKI